MNFRSLRYTTLVTTFSLMLLSCSFPQGTLQTVSVTGSGLRLYLQPLPQEAHRLTLTLSGISATQANGTEIPLVTGPAELKGQDLTTTQKRLFSGDLPEGLYTGLTLRFASAMLLTDEGDTSLLLPAGPISLNQEFRIESHQALALFITLSPERLVTDGYRFTPTLSLWKSLPVLPSLKGVISNGDAGTLTIFEKKTPMVVSIITVGQRPQEMALDAVQHRAYVALQGENSIAVLDIVTEQTQDKLRLRSGDAPKELALSPDGRKIVTANVRSNSISILDTSPLSERGRIQLITSPASVFFGPFSDRAYVVQPETNALTVVDLERQQVLTSINLEASPVRGAASADGRSLFLITEDSPNMLVLDAASLVIVDRVLVGYGATCLTVNPGNGLIYVGRNTGEIVLVDPKVSIPIDTFKVAGDVTYLALDREENTLFAVSSQKQQITKIDLVSKKHLGTLDTDPGPFSLVVMGE